MKCVRAGIPVQTQLVFVDRPLPANLFRRGQRGECQTRDDSSMPPSYYNLRQIGFQGFQSSVTPNWQSMLKSGGLDNAQMQTALKVLTTLHFIMLLDADGK